MQMIDAPNLGQAMTFLPDRGDDTLRADCVLQPGAATPMHVHLRQSERFEMRSGALDVWVDDVRRTVTAGDSETFAPGAAHRFHNASGAPVEVSVAIWPALRTRELFETLFALDAAGRLDRRGAPSPLRFGLLAERFGDELFFLAALPPRLQLRVGRSLGRLAAALRTELLPS